MHEIRDDATVYSLKIASLAPSVVSPAVLLTDKTIALQDAPTFRDLIAAEARLPNPSTSGWVLSSTKEGVRSWVAPNAHSHATTDVTGLQTALDGKLGTVTADATSRAANTVYAAPSGSAGAGAFRELVAADIPSLDTGKLTSGTLGFARGGTGMSAPGATAGNLRWNGSSYQIDTAVYARASGSGAAEQVATWSDASTTTGDVGFKVIKSGGISYQLHVGNGTHYGELSLNSSADTSSSIYFAHGGMATHILRVDSSGIKLYTNTIDGNTLDVPFAIAYGAGGEITLGGSSTTKRNINFTNHTYTSNSATIAGGIRSTGYDSSTWGSRGGPGVEICWVANPNRGRVLAFDRSYGTRETLELDGSSIQFALNAIVKSKITSNGFYAPLSPASTSAVVSGTDGLLSTQDGATFCGTIGAVPVSSGVVGVTLVNSTSFTSSFTQDIFGTTANGYFLREVRTQENAPGSLLGVWSSGLAWKGNDTYGSLMVGYSESKIRVSGGTGTNPSWTADLWHTANLSNPVSGTGAAGCVAYWSGSSSITSSAGLQYDGTNLIIGGSGANCYIANGGTIYSGLGAGALSLRQASGGAFLRMRVSGSYNLVFDTSDGNSLSFDVQGHILPYGANPCNLGASSNKWSSLFVSGICLGDSAQLSGNGTSVLAVTANTTLPTPVVGKLLFIYCSSVVTGMGLTAPSGYAIRYRDSGTTYVTANAGTYVPFMSAFGIAVGIATTSGTPIWYLAS